MKLYLSSYRVPVPEKLFALLSKPAKDCKVVILSDAKYYHEPKVREIKLNEVKRDLEKLGFACTFLRLADYSSAEKLKKVLETYALIWAAGGNTFMLRYEMWKSGFDEIISDLLEQGIVYGGESAGALVAGKSLKGAEHADDPTLTPKIIWDGLMLINKMVIPHEGNTDFGGAIEKIRQVHATDPDLVVLTDYQALVIDGGKSEIISANK